jgi:hypothetical protein
MGAAVAVAVTGHAGLRLVNSNGFRNRNTGTYELGERDG